MQENDNNEVIEFSFTNNTSYREIRQMSDKSSSSKRENFSDSLKSSKNKAPNSKIQSWNKLTKGFSNEELTNTINYIMKKEKQNIYSRNNTVN